MRGVVIILVLVLAVSGARDGWARDECTHSWTRGNLKSYKQIEHEIREQAAGNKILRVALCKGAGAQYYRVKVLTGAGAVRSIRISAE